MIHDILDACEEALKTDGNPESACWLASLMVEMKIWRASEHDVRAAIEKDINEFGELSRFARVAGDEYILRAWTSHRGK
jgi:hypothetical protein